MGIQINGQTDTVTATDGSINVGGDVTIPGVLTYEDVTNVDSVGVITARDGLNVTGGSVGIGTDNPSRRIHINSGSTDTAMLIESTDGDVQINLKDVDSSDGVSIGCDQDDFYVRTGLTTERLRITSAGLLQLDNGNQITAADTTTYIGLGGGNSTSNGANMFLYGGSHASNASAFVFRTNTTERLRITSTGKCEVYKGTSITGKTLGSEAFTVGNGASNKRFSVYPEIAVIGGQGVINNYNILLQNNGQAVFSGIGIGTATPGRHLTVSGGASEGAIQITNNTSGHTAANGFELIHFTSGETQFLNRENGDMRFDTNGTERLRITSAGQLNLAGNMQFTAATPELEFNNGGPRFRVPAANTLTIHTGGGLGATSNERLRITSAGQMGLGTNDPNSYGGNVKLAVANTSGTCGLSIVSATNGDGNLYYADGTSGDATYRGYIRYNHTLDQFRIGIAGAERLRITPTTASVSSTGSGANGVGCVGIDDNGPDSRASGTINWWW